MTHVVHIGDRAPVVLTDHSTGKRRTFGTETEDGWEDTVEVRTQADVDLLVGHLPDAYVIPQAEASEAPESNPTPPSTPSGRGRGRNQP